MRKTTNKYSLGVRKRAVRMVLSNEGQHESRWPATLSISPRIRCASQTLDEWVKKVEIDADRCGGVPTEMVERMRALGREVRELKWANEILREASAYFPGRNSTAHRNDDPLHRRSPRHPRGRANLPRVADRPVH